MLTRHTKLFVVLCAIAIIITGVLVCTSNFLLPKPSNLAPSNGMGPIDFVPTPIPHYITWSYQFAALFYLFLAIAVLSTAFQFRSRFTAVIITLTSIWGVGFATRFIGEIASSSFYSSTHPTFWPRQLPGIPGFINHLFPLVDPNMVTTSIIYLSYLVLFICIITIAILKILGRPAHDSVRNVAARSFGIFIFAILFLPKLWILIQPYGMYFEVPSFLTVCQFLFSALSSLAISFALYRITLMPPRVKRPFKLIPKSKPWWLDENGNISMK